MLLSFLHDFAAALRATSFPEFVAVLAGIGSVLLSRAENIWLYPVGLVNTVFYIWLSWQGHLPGEASVNLFYTAVSLYGWWLWAARSRGAAAARDAAAEAAPTNKKSALRITFSSRREWAQHLAFAGVLYGVLFYLLREAKASFAPGAIPWADAFASATAYTGMWLMARKKVESWYWWLATDLASVPLYYAKGYAFTTVQFAVFTVLAVAGLLSWRRKAG